MSSHTRVYNPDRFKLALVGSRLVVQDIRNPRRPIRSFSTASETETTLASYLSTGGGTLTGELTLTSYRTAIEAVSTNTVLDGTHSTVLCSNTITITLPAASGCSGRIYRIKNTGTGTITVDGNGSETIDGDTTKDITAQYDSIAIQSDGSNWHLV